MAKKIDDRARNWTFVFYPDSAPEDFLERIRQWHICGALSPLHDKDIRANGEYKKPHYHLVLAFEGKKSYEQVMVLVDELNAPHPPLFEAVVRDMRGMLRYLTHSDDPDKYQYESKDVITIAGLDYEKYTSPSSSQRYIYINEMCEWICENGVMEFETLFDYARYHHYGTWYKVLCDSSCNIMIKYINSKRNSIIASIKT